MCAANYDKCVSRYILFYLVFINEIFQWEAIMEATLSASLSLCLFVCFSLCLSVIFVIFVICHFCHFCNFLSFFVREGEGGERRGEKGRGAFAPKKHSHCLSQFWANPRPALKVHIWWLWKLRWMLLQNCIIPNGQTRKYK